MITLFRFILFVLVSGACIFFALNNQEPMDMTWSPIHDPVTVPAYVIGLSGLGAGFLIGVFMGWLVAIPLKYTSYKQKKQIAKLEKQLEEFVEPDPITNIVEES